MKELSRNTHKGEHKLTGIINRKLHHNFRRFVTSSLFQTIDNLENFAGAEMLYVCLIVS